MGSTTSPKRSSSHTTVNSSSAAASAAYEDGSVSELRNLLQVRDQEIQTLKYELDKYKLALQQSQLNCHIVQQQLEKHQLLLAKVNNATKCGLDNAADTSGSGIVEESRTNDDSGVIQDEQESTEDILAGQSSRLPPHRRFELSSTPLRAPSRSAKVLFKTGDDDSEDGHSDIGGLDHEHSISNTINNSAKTMTKSEENLEDIIHDVGEIDLQLELSKVASRRSSAGPRSQSIDEDEEDEDVISDEMLTSLTDAAISNLSQLAALQEQCESQQQHSQNYQHQTTTVGGVTKSPSSKPKQPTRQQSSHSSSFSASAGEQSTSAAATPISPQNIVNPMRLMEHRQSKTVDFTQDPFSSVSISSQAAIAISAAAAAAAATVSTCSSPMVVSSSCQPHASHQTMSSSSSVSPNSTIQSDLTTTNHSLAKVVAAAAVAAAVANDQHQQQQHSPLNPNNNNHPQSRLLSSALPSQDYYQNILHHHNHHHNQQQEQRQQQQQYHQQSHHHVFRLPSALSSLNFSPSTSITPSPCSLLDGSSQSTRRSTTSNASSSMVSPTTLPNYLRRQLVPSADRIPSISPSQSSGLATGPSSGASSSLAHILHHHQSQQRSASALAGRPISSSPVSGTPLSGTGSSAISPLMSNKISSQARLNNMQIRHKFGYLGSGKAQFNSPHGFCLGLNQEIVVADTNNHRVCIFDKSGTYLTQFGSPGKEEGQLWNPRKVAILHRPIQGSGSGTAGNSNSTSMNQRLNSSYSGALPEQSSGQLATLNGSEPLYVVCDRGAERSRMQLFTKDGAFIKKIGIHYIDIVAGLAITQNGLIIVVDSVSPTVYIINGETGILNGWFDCSGYMKEPSDIAVKSDLPGNEYFICDFKGHCVVVFSEQGEYLRKIGHDGLTSYPNGIDISDDGDILVGDSHGNRFHVVVFDRNGNFVSQFECPHVKVSRCCGLKITREGYIVTLAKNNHHVLVLDTIHI